jgi:phosphate transport system substrate-binding protein
MRTMTRLILALVISSLVFGCVSSALGSVMLNGAGATFPQPLYNKWFYDFNKLTGVQVNYQGIGSGGGIKALKAGTVNFAGSDAPLSNSELASFPPVVQIPTCGGPVAVAYSLHGLGKYVRLTPATLSAIFLGEITKWNDPRLVADNPGITLPNKSITVAHRSDGSGTTYLFTSYLAAVSPQWRSRVGAGKEVKWPVGEGGKGNPGVAGILKTVPGSIGYVEMTYALQNGLLMAPIKNRAGRFISPSVGAATAAIRGALRSLRADLRSSIVNPAGAEAYPICGLTFILAYKQQGDKTAGAELVRLLNWLMSPSAQQTAATYQYAPLPAEIIAINKQLINEIK